MRTDTLIYVVKSGEYIKIGVSSTSTWPTRHSTLQAYSPEPLSIVYIGTGDRKLEKKLHDAIAEWHAHHEWFHDSQDVRLRLRAHGIRTIGSKP